VTPCRGCWSARGVRNLGALPDLSEGQLLAWADAHQRRTGDWPLCANSEPIPEAPGERWRNLDQLLRAGGRGLPGGDSLPQLLARARGVRNLSDLPPLTAGRIAAWARAHRRRTGGWPALNSGPVADAPGESWFAVNTALRDGGRGLPGGDSLAQLLARVFGVRNQASVPELTEGQILAWADAHRARTGGWPRVASGPIAEAPGETWLRVSAALWAGLRGLPGGSSLPQLLAARRGARNKAQTPKLTEEQVLGWADAHRARMGRWPDQWSGSIAEAEGETWGAVNAALREGLRGLTGGDTVHRLLCRRRQAGPERRR
jgi:hypothetical protein